jgi:hypothetical protein
MCLTVPVGFSAARIATIGPHPIIKFRHYILPILRKSLSRAVQVIRQPATAFYLAALHLLKPGFSVPYPPVNLGYRHAGKQFITLSGSTHFVTVSMPGASGAAGH